MQPNLIILYVTDPLRSCAFYQSLFGIEPDAIFPTYSAFSFENGLNLGLWSTHAQDFTSGGSGHRTELCFLVESEKQVEELYQNWQQLGVEIEQRPVTAIFGRTFVALDPDGHRLRVCLPDD
ncbi:VOC family protein [Winslowiella iniecta]|uniref:Phenazine antibiotic resistance protein n=1 Tax=Winslowiella iniecta TaxID=1560201 RepID=A0A0L7T7B5_9GAMM|nr:VOC family protein [Winslowiella iniecta]KOC91245.1 glyoxalase [Winslowiella iniecta]KOC94554.1 glyoxalase [Winslowiella iniecta]